MRCQVCQAPAVGKRCPFCHVELPPSGAVDAQALLDHLAETVPGAQSHRGAFERGEIREVELPGGYTARLRRDDLELKPEAPVEEWVEIVLADLRRRAQSDFELRLALTRRGWSLR